eukprot:2999353-Rhodomonas_salina.1
MPVSGVQRPAAVMGVGLRGGHLEGRPGEGQRGLASDFKFGQPERVAGGSGLRVGLWSAEGGIDYSQGLRKPSRRPTPSQDLCLVFAVTQDLCLVLCCHGAAMQRKESVC